MNNEIRYNQLKRDLLDKDNLERLKITKHEAYHILHGSQCVALNKLDDESHEMVRGEKEWLQMTVKGLGESGSLELLAALGNALGGTHD